MSRFVPWLLSLAGLASVVVVLRSIEDRGNPVVVGGMIMALGAGAGLAVVGALGHRRLRRMRAESALTEERFAAVAEQLPGVVYSYDHLPNQGRILHHIGPGLDDLLGPRSAAAVRADFDQLFELIHPDDRERLRVLAANGVRDRSTVDIELRMRTDQDMYQWVRSVCRPIPLPNGGSRWHILLLDIDDYERALNASEDRFRRILQDLPDLVCRSLPDTTVVFVNDAYAKAFGKSPAELVGTSFLDLVAPMERDTVREHLKSLSAAQPVKVIVHRVVATDGQVRWQEWTDRALFDDHGTMVGIQSIGRDVTERQDTHAELARRRDVERMLFRELNHRVRNNLASLLSLLELSSRTSTDLREFSQAMTGRVQTMAHVHEMLNGSRVGATDFRSMLTMIVPPTSRDAVRLDGPDVRIPGRQSLAAGLLFHELVANSERHGALASEQGTVHVAWRMEARPDDQFVLTCTWTERGGPALPPEVSRGTGTMLIEGFARTELRGTATLGFGRDGVDHQFEFTLDPTTRVDSAQWRPAEMTVVTEPWAPIESPTSVRTE